MTVSIIEFSKFHNLLTAQRKDYHPYYIQLEKGGKNPINKVWKLPHTNEGHTYKDAMEWMAKGFNTGIVATDRDPLVIIDIDNLEKITDIKPTLRTRSRKRAGLHYFYFGTDKDTKVIIPTGGNGEVRARWAYVVTAGSYINVDFNKNPKDKEIYDSLPPEQQVQFGLYTVDNELPVSDITFDEFPVEFKERYKTEKDSKNRSKMPDAEYEKYVKEHTENQNESAIYKLKIENIIGHHDTSERFHSPIHDSSTDANSSVSEGVHHCWRHYVAHSPLQLLGALAGVLQCEDAGKGHNGRSESQLNLQDGETLYRIWEYAKKEGMIPIEDKPPALALVWFATHEDICKITEVKYGWKLGANYYKALKELETRKLIGGLCSNCFKTKPVECKTLCQECLDYMNQKKNNGSKKESEYKPTTHVENGCIGITKFKKELNENNESVTVPYFEALTNYKFEIIREVSSIDYETKENKIEFEAKIVIGDKKKSFNIDSKTSSKNELFEIAIKNTCGSDAKFKHHDITTIREAFNDSIESSKIQKIDKVPMGWNKEEYVMKSVIITKDGIKKNDKYLMDVPETSPARFIDMPEITDEEFKMCGEGYIKNFFPLHDRYFVQMAIADAYGAPFQRRLGECKNVDEYKFPKIDRGSPSAGKSYVERLIQSHYGIFPSDDSYMTWGSSTYAVESEGGNFRDVVFLADDLSRDILNNEYERVKFHKLLHNYVSGVGRNVLKQNREMNHAKPIGGMFEITAENTVTEGAAAAGRVCYVDVPSLSTLEDGITLTPESQPIFDKRKEHGIWCHSMKHLYPGFMARYILEVIQNENWLDNYAGSYIKTQTEFLQLTGTGDYRSIKMHAIRYVHFEMFCNFMVKKGFMTVDERTENLSFLKDKMVERIEETSSSIKNERPINITIEKLTQLIGNGTIPRAQRHEYVDDAHSKNPVGIVFDDIKHPDLAFGIPDSIMVFMRKHAKESGKSFEFTQEDIGKELKARGMIKLCDTYKTEKGEIKERNTFQINFNGSKIRTWCVSRASISIPDAVIESQAPLFDVAMMAGEMFDRLGLIDNNPPTIKQYNMVMAQLITASRPDLTKSDKNRVWNELDKYVKLYCAGRKWIITVKVNEESIKDGESQIKQLSEQKPQQPLTCPEISKLNNLSTNYPINLTEL